jgi:hypothetical protein
MDKTMYKQGSELWCSRVVGGAPQAAIRGHQTKTGAVRAGSNKANTASLDGEWRESSGIIVRLFKGRRK